MDIHPLQQTVKSFYGNLSLHPDDCVAVALSGGSDSVALLAATVYSGVPCVALHCNFHLRGEESIRDEVFAHDIASKFGCGFCVIHFDAKVEAKLSGESVEMACRRLRYDWFARVLAEGVECVDAASDCGVMVRPKFIALGHHSADNVETFMLNLSRSSGLKGLSGIPRQRGSYIRPMLNMPKSEILDFLQLHNLKYITDSTNLVADCRRNVWRLKLLPTIEQEFPGFSRAVESTMSNIESERRLLDSLIDIVAPSCIAISGEINLEVVAACTQSAVLLWHLLCRYGAFSLSTAESVLQSWRDGNSGKRFYSRDGDVAYELHRGVLVPCNSDCDENEAEYLVPARLLCGGGMLDKPIRLRFDVLAKSEFSPHRDSSKLWLDLDAINADGQPLMMRRWRRGDRISPFGMTGTQLVSDLFSDNHLSNIDKQRVWLLTCGDKILWVIGLRCSRHFTVTTTTTSVLRITAEP